MNDDSVLMKLSRAEEAGKIDCSVGVIAISNKIQYVDNVNERVKSSFQHKELFFKPYDANQLREIMFNREDAFQDGVLSEDVIPLSAAFAAQEHGDARKAIDILRHAGEVAYEAGAEQVTEEHVRQAQQHAEKDRFRELVNGAPTQAKASLLALTELSVNSNDAAFLTSRVYDQYERICNHLDMDILSVRRFRDILKSKPSSGLSKSRRSTRGVRAASISRTDSLKILRSSAKRFSRTAGCRTGLASSDLLLLSGGRRRKSGVGRAETTETRGSKITSETWGWFQTTEIRGWAWSLL